MKAVASRFLLLALICFGAGCANITTPTGGRKDTTPPKLVSIDPADSLLNTRVKRIEMHFNEYVTIADVSKELQISPILSVAPTMTGTGKKAIVKIADTLLEDNTTYRLSFGSSIKDLHEGNPFGHYTYTFSTGGYFDSLQISGSVINAATGLPDTGRINVMLYSAAGPDSSIVRHKPKYITRTDNSGYFSIKGLPDRKFKIYALKDANDNLIYDGPPEMIAFTDRIIQPGDTAKTPILLKIFQEHSDTSAGAKNKSDSISAAKVTSRGKKDKEKENAGLSYTVNADTSNANKRSFDVNLNLTLTFNKKPLINKDKVILTYDSSGTTIIADRQLIVDTAHPNVLQIKPEWRDNTAYTLKLSKGFAKDTGGVDALPGRFTFRTKQDEDYGKIQVHLPSKYYGRQYVLVAFADNDSFYQKPVLDTIIVLSRLKPAKYKFRLIVDKNENGKWDTGDLFGKIQPEDVIPYNDIINLRAGYDDIIDDWDKKLPVKKASAPPALPRSK